MLLSFFFPPGDINNLHFFIVSGEDNISVGLLQLADGGASVSSYESILVLEDCKRFDQNSFQGKTQSVMLPPFENMGISHLTCPIYI